ncbi:MAG: AMP-binding protein [Aliihoeflea sp.]
MNPAEWLARTARLHPLNDALALGGRTIADYRTFARHAASIGGGLRERLGIRPGDRVALFMGNRAVYLPMLYGIWFVGAVAVPINAKLHPREASWIIENAGASVVFTEKSLSAGLGGVAPDCVKAMIEPDSDDFEALLAAAPMAAPIAMAGDDVAWLFYTSGTTGRPKGVMITARNIQTMALAYFADVDQVYPADAALYAAPLSHGAGLYNFMHVMRGVRHVVPESGGFEPEEIARLARTIGDVSMFAAPTMVRRLVDHARKSAWAGEGIRTIVYGGGPMYLPDIIEAVDVMGPRFVQIYGQGESPMTITALSRDRVADRLHPRWRERLASVGTAQSPIEVRIADGEGRALPAGEAGEILARGDAVMRGYWNNPDATAAALKDGWLWTGDIGTMDADGFVTLQDRSKDVIISGGTNIYPREVEEALLAHPRVREVSVVGAPNAEWGEEVVAFVVAVGEGRLEDELDAHCRELIARFKRPKRYVFLDELPKNNYGKVLKTELREHLKPGGAASSS